MADSLEQIRDRVVHLYYMDFIKDHFGLLKRPDVCIALEFQVWLETFHPTLAAFGDSGLDKFNKISEWVSHPDLDYHELLDYFNRFKRKH
ncbi:hypothetical protein [Oceanobacter kriegii]|uniref:hypothetical protein n=1 Tax=Oceanobacter kriegii TaxID=64972 RepID=UPI000425829C|nr:hypothetical protein [Oceanobacter kriegii]